MGVSSERELKGRIGAIRKDGNERLVKALEGGRGTYHLDGWFKMAFVDGLWMSSLRVGAAEGDGDGISLSEFVRFPIRNGGG